MLGADAGAAAAVRVAVEGIVQTAPAVGFAAGTVVAGLALFAAGARAVVVGALALTPEVAFLGRAAVAARAAATVVAAFQPAAVRGTALAPVAGLAVGAGATRAAAAVVAALHAAAVGLADACARLAQFVGLAGSAVVAAAVRTALDSLALGIATAPVKQGADLAVRTAVVLAFGEVTDALVALAVGASHAGVWTAAPAAVVATGLATAGGGANAHPVYALVVGFFAGTHAAATVRPAGARRAGGTAAAVGAAHVIGRTTGLVALGIFADALIEDQRVAVGVKRTILGDPLAAGIRIRIAAHVDDARIPDGAVGRALSAFVGAAAGVDAAVPIADVLVLAVELQSVVGYTIAVRVQSVAGLGAEQGAIFARAAGLPGSGTALGGQVVAVDADAVGQFARRQDELGIIRVGAPVAVVVDPVTLLASAGHTLALTLPGLALLAFGAVAGRLAAGNADAALAQVAQGAVVLGQAGHAGARVGVADRQRLGAVCVRAAGEGAGMAITDLVGGTVPILQALDAGAMGAQIGGAKQVARAIAVVFAATNAVHIGTDVAQRAVVERQVFDALKAARIAATARTVRVVIAAGCAGVVLADLARAAVRVKQAVDTLARGSIAALGRALDILAARKDAAVVLAGESGRAIAVHQALGA